MQEAIKELLIYLRTENLSEYVYLGFHLLSFLVVVPIFLWLSKKMSINRGKAFFALLINCIVFLVLMHFIGYIEASLGLGNFGRKNVVTVYIWIPLICVLTADMLKMHRGSVVNMMAFAMPFIQAVSRPGCIVAGCCKGFVWQWGVYHPWTASYRFPMPIVEMLWMFGIAFLMLYILKRNNYRPLRFLYPLMMIIYGMVQFFSEFYIDNQKIWNSFSLRSFHELSIVVVGFVWLAVLFNLWLKERERKNRFKKPNQKKKQTGLMQKS